MITVAGNFNAVHAQTYSAPEADLIRELIRVHGAEYDSLADLIADYAEELDILADAATMDAIAEAQAERG